MNRNTSKKFLSVNIRNIPKYFTLMRIARAYENPPAMGVRQRPNAKLSAGFRARDRPGYSAMRVAQVLCLAPLKATPSPISWGRVGVGVYRWF